MSLDHFLKSFTIVTEGAAVIARAANVSDSTDSHTQGEARLGCMAHFLNNFMKDIIVSCTRDGTLQVVASCFNQ